MKWRTKNLLKILVVVMILIMIPQVIHATELAVEPNDPSIDSQTYTTEVATNSEDSQNNPETIELSGDENVQEDVNTEDSENQKETISEESVDDNEGELVDDSLDEKETVTTEDAIDTNADSEVKKNENEEAEESKETKPETISEEPTIENEENETNRALKKNETIVTSYAELKKLIENKGNGVYDTYYLGADIETQSNGIKVPYGYGFVIDGTNPNTGVRHTINEIEKTSYSTSDSIVYTGGGSVTLTLRNVDLIGRGRYGFFYTMNSSTTQVFDNVHFTGVTITSGGSSRMIFNESTVIQQSKGNNDTLIKGEHVIIRGNTTFESFDTGNLAVMNLNGGSFTVDNDANFTFNTDRNAIMTPLATINSGGTMTINATSRSSRKNITSLIVFDNFHIYQGTFNVNVDETVDTPQIVTLQYTSMDQADVNINFKESRNPLRAKYDLSLYNSTLNISGNKVLEGGSAILNDLGGVYFKNSKINIDIDEYKWIKPDPGTKSNAGIIESEGMLALENSQVSAKTSILEPIGFFADELQLIDNSKIYVEIREGARRDIFSADSSVEVVESEISVILAENISGEVGQSIFKSDAFYFSDPRIHVYVNDKQIKSIFNVGAVFSSNISGTQPHISL